MGEIRKGRRPTIIDGLTQDCFQKWTNKRDFFLGAHIPMLEVVTKDAIDKGSELFINYNR